MGPTKKQLLDDQRARFEEDALFRWTKKEAYLRKKMSARVTKCDQATLQSIVKLGILKYELELAAEMQELLNGEGVRLARFFWVYH